MRQEYYERRVKMKEGKAHRLEPRIYYYMFGPSEPALTIKSGDIVVARTRDARGFNERMESMPEEMKQHSATTLLCERDPLVGPIFVDEAEPGDALMVTIQRIKLNRNYAWSGHRSHFGSLTGETPSKRLFLNEPVPEAKFDWHLDLKKNTGTRLEDETHIMTAGSGRPLMDCVRIAQVELVKWLVDDYGFEKWEAFQVISQVGTMRIGNAVDPGYTVVGKFPKKYLAGYKIGD